MRRTPTSRARWLVAAGAAIVLAGGAVWAVTAARDDAPPRPASAARGMANMPGMAGMAGMQAPDGRQAVADGSVRLGADQIRQFGITFGTAEVRTLTSQLRAVGSVVVDETRVAQVAPRFGGFVERLYVATTGQPVRRGQPLMDVYAPEVAAAQEELLVARRLDRTLDESAVPGVPAGSGDLLAAARRRLRSLDVSEAQVDAVLRTGRARRTVTLYAPASGVVVEKKVIQGQAIQPGEPLYTIADLSAVWVDVDLREGDVGGVRPGTAAALDLPAYPGRPFTGRVAYVYPTLETATRTVRARVEVANGDGRLKPGMYATVRLTTPERRALTVPTSAVVRTGERSLVFVDMGGGQLMPHEVETGRTAGDYTEVLTGVASGQRVVTSAQFLLESESNIGDVMKAMMGQMGAGGAMGDMGAMDGMDTKGADMRGMPGMAMPGMAMPGMAMPGMAMPAAPATGGGTRGGNAP